MQNEQTTSGYRQTTKLTSSPYGLSVDNLTVNHRVPSKYRAGQAGRPLIVPKYMQLEIVFTIINFNG